MKSWKRVLVSISILALITNCGSSTSKENLKEESQENAIIKQSTGDKITANNMDDLHATDTVKISGMKFNPEELHVQKGATVIWINDGIVPHDVTDFPDRGWTSDTIRIGESWMRTIDESFDYFCGIHITMKGKIVVDL